MKPTNKIPKPDNLPADAHVVDFEEGKQHIRVTVKEFRAPDGRTVLRAQAFEVTAKGNFRTDRSGSPVMTEPKLLVVTSRTADGGELHSLKPGWIHVNLKPGDVPHRADPRNIESDSVPTKPPASGDEDMWALVGVDYYRWDEGEISRMARKAAAVLIDKGDFLP